MKKICVSPLVSIGLAVRNGEDYIHLTLKSLLSQSFKNFELIISDNFSNDNTEKICKKFAKKDFRVRFIKQKKNIGYFENLNTVLKKSKGKYFMWAAHDDLYKKIHIENLLEVHKINKQIAVAMAGTIHIDERGKKIGEIFFDTILFDKKNKNLLLKNIALQPAIYRQKFGYFMYGLWKSSLIKKLIPFPKCKFGDNIFILKAAIYYKFAFVPTLTFLKRKFNIHPSLKYAKHDPTTSKYFSSGYYSLLSILVLFKELFLIKKKYCNLTLKVKIIFYYSYWVFFSIIYNIIFYFYFRIKKYIK